MYSSLGSSRLYGALPLSFTTNWKVHIQSEISSDWVSVGMTGFSKLPDSIVIGLLILPIVCQVGVLTWPNLIFWRNDNEIAPIIRFYLYVLSKKPVFSIKSNLITHYMYLPNVLFVECSNWNISFSKRYI